MTLQALQILLDGRQARDEAKRTEKAIDRTADAADRASRRGTRAFRGWGREILNWKTILVGALAALGGKSIIDAGLRMDALRTAMGAIAEDARIGGNELAFLRAEADRLGLRFDILADAYKGLAAASKNTAMQGDNTRELFIAVAEAATVMRLSADDTAGTLRALQQMMSKGTIQAEELRAQLGDRLPGAVQILAAALGVSTRELNKMLEQGQVISSEALPKMANELRKRFAGGVEAASNSAQASLNRFSNAIFDLKVAIADSGLLEALTILVNGTLALGRDLNIAVPRIFDAADALDVWKASAEGAVSIMRAMIRGVGFLTKGVLMMVEAFRAAQDVMATLLTRPMQMMAPYMNLLKDPAFVKNLALGGPMSIFNMPKIAAAWNESFDIGRRMMPGEIDIVGDIDRRLTEAANKINALQSGWEDFDYLMTHPMQGPPMPRPGPRSPGLIPNPDPNSVEVPRIREQEDAVARLRRLVRDANNENLTGMAAQREAARAWLEDQQAEVEELGEKGKLSMGEIEDAMIALSNTYVTRVKQIPDDMVSGFQAAAREWGDINERMGKVGAGTAEIMAQGFTDAAMAAIENWDNAGEAIQKIMNDMMMQLIRLAIQELIVKQLLSSILPTGHAGGVVGSLRTRRMHGGGLAADEMPVIAKKGEVIFTPEQLGALGKVIAANQTKQQAGGTIANFFDPDEIGRYIAAHPETVINVISRRAPQVRRVLAN